MTRTTEHTTDGEAHDMADQAETFNPWSVVNLVFNHLADADLHPVLGESGDPRKAAEDLLRALGIEPAPDHAGPAARPVQNELEELRKRMMPGIE
ncbi:hypothetical protein [Pseudonocardia ailaonensis]|uniref:hypothetical protein n=1 Tax=Pseudonocardia ailaonensis TaxID=367279 RepID=UPI003CD0960D